MKTLSEVKNSALVFEENTQTLRLMPENYLVAIRPHAGRWILDPDAAVPVELVLKVQDVIHSNYDLKWGSGLRLLAALTPTWEGIENYASTQEAV